MTVESPVPPVGDNEVLARFIVASKWVRNDGTVKQDAFIPHPYTALSVTRHLGLSGPEIWVIAQRVASFQGKNLYGRADLAVSNVKEAKLTVNPDPTPENSNHAEIKGWPPEKSAQKSYAQQLAKDASYVEKPAG
jgi:hypothetical protein